MRVVLIAAVVVLLAAAVIVVSPGRLPLRVQAQSGCDASTLNSAYGYQMNGIAYDSQYNVYYLAGTGRLAGDGNGNLTGSETFNLDGDPRRRTFTGTYTLNADCTGAVNLTYSDKWTTAADIVVVNNGKEVNFNETDSYIVYSGAWKRISQ